MDPTHPLPRQLENFPQGDSPAVIPQSKGPQSLILTKTREACPSREHNPYNGEVLGEKKTWFERECEEGGGGPPQPP